ncbi:MAG TPA: hypothetical protein ENK55_10610 [Actinobacteria bacterium]|nr:hypothetical protein [Actinomycetota bacterium]
MRRTIPILVAAVLTLAACSGGSEPTTTAGSPTSEATSTPSAGEGTTISIEDFAFHPADLTVPVGTTIEWRNDEGGVAHTATSDEGTWDSGTLQPGDTYALTLDTPGTFTYFCSIHPSMTGSITVES